MFCNRKSMKKVNKIKERCLRLMTNNYKLSYEELLVLTNEIYPHQRCLNELSPDIMNDVLAVSKHQYNTQHYNLFVTEQPKIDRYGQNSSPYRANQIWNFLLLAVKLETSHKPTKPSTNQPKHPQTTQTSHKLATNQPQISQTTHKPTKSLKNQPNHPKTTNKPAANQPNYLETSRKLAKPPT